MALYVLLHIVFAIQKVETVLFINNRDWFMVVSFTARGEHGLSLVLSKCQNTLPKVGPVVSVCDVTILPRFEPFPHLRNLLFHRCLVPHTRRHGRERNVVCGVVYPCARGHAQEVVIVTCAEVDAIEHCFKLPETTRAGHVCVVMHGRHAGAGVCIREVGACAVSGKTNLQRPAASK